MNVSKILLAALVVICLSGHAVFAQSEWATNGSDIYNTNAGKVGIGTMTPEWPLTVEGAGTQITQVTSSDGGAVQYRLKTNSTNRRIVAANNAGATQSQIEFKDAGEIHFHGPIADSRVVFDALGRVGIGTTSPANTLHVQGSIYLPAAGGRLTWNNGNAEIGVSAYDLTFDTYTGSALTEKMRITSAGNVGIGTTSPTHELTVDGNIGAEEIVVVPDVAPDFVFENDYALRSLEEVEEYIDAHGHLPEIPSAAEMEAEGVGLAEMQMKLLQKIEELTLYLIEQQNENALLKERLAQLETAGN